MSKVTKRSGGTRRGAGRPVGAMNKDKGRPYFATIKNAILRKHKHWIEEIEYTLGIMNDDAATDERRDAARDTLLAYTHTKPTIAETQPSQQLGFDLQWSNGDTPFDPATLQTAEVAAKGAQLN